MSRMKYNRGLKCAENKNVQNERYDYYNYLFRIENGAFRNLALVSDDKHGVVGEIAHCLCSRP